MIRPLLGVAVIAATIIGGTMLGVVRVLTDTAPDL